MILNTFLIAVANILYTMINVYMWIVILACVLSFVNPDPYNKFVQVIYRLTQPAFDLVRKLIPTTFAGLDFAPVIIIIALQFINNFFIRLIFHYAA